VSADHPPQGWLATLFHLWLLRRVRSAPSGDPLRACALMTVLWLAAWVGIDHWQSKPEPRFFAPGIPLLAWYVLATAALAALLRWGSRPAPAFAPVLALTIGAVPVPLLFASVAAVVLEPRWVLATGIAVGIYSLLYFAHGLHALTGTRQRAAACAGLLFLAGFFWLSDRLDAIPDVWTPLETLAADSGDSTADAEALLFEQAARIDESLGAVRRPASARSEAFFLGFAGVGAGTVPSGQWPSRR
jgi:hypothetical protein